MRSVLSSQYFRQLCQQLGALLVSAYGNTQELVNPRLAEMAHDNPLFAQFAGKLGGIVLRMADKQKVGRRRQHHKTQRGQFGSQPLATGDDPVADLAEIFAIGKGGSSPDNGGAIQRIGVEAVLDSLQPFDQSRMTNGQPYPQPGQRA